MSLDTRAQRDANIHTLEARKALISGDLNKVQREVTRAETIERLAARVVEPTTYGPNSRNSWFADQMHANDPVPSTRRDEAQTRLNRHNIEMAYEARSNSPIGKAVRAQIAAGVRSETSDVTQRAVEQAIDHLQASAQRAMTSGSNSGGSFVVPVYDVADAGPYYDWAPSVGNAAVPVSDPGYGLELFVPAWTSGETAVVPQLSENTSPPALNVDASSAYLSTPLETLWGETIVSQQLLDRAGPVGFDQLILGALGRSTNTAFDLAVITAILANAGTVTDTKTTAANTAIIADLWSDLSAAKSAIRNDAGVRLPTSHIFLPATLADYLMSLTDGSGRPLITPTAPAPGQDSGVAPFANILNVPAYVNGNLPLVSGNSQLVVANMGEVFALRSATNYRIVPQTGAATFSVYVQAHTYAGAIVRQAGAVQQITGARYPATATFAQV